MVASPSLGHDELCESVYAHGLSITKSAPIMHLINLLFGLCKSI